MLTKRVHRFTTPIVREAPRPAPEPAGAALLW